MNCSRDTVKCSQMVPREYACSELWLGTSETTPHDSQRTLMELIVSRQSQESEDVKYLQMFPNEQSLSYRIMTVYWIQCCLDDFSLKRTSIYSKYLTAERVGVMSQSSCIKA